MQKSKQFDIGVFDSGIGGTSIWKEINALLPYQDTLYLSDSKNAPYGQKSKEKIIDLCVKNTELLLNNGSKIIVVACNTATTNAISYLRKTYDVPFIGIEPAIKPAGLKTTTKAIGILATKGTLNSELFEKTSSTLNDDIKIYEQIGEGLVELIENGKIDSAEMKELLSSYLNPMLAKNIDCLVLGCTHYPYLIPQIRKIVGEEITIIDSGLAVAKQTKRILEKHNLLSENKQTGSHLFFTNTNKLLLENFLPKSKNITVVKKDF